jgi:ribonuclease P protein component
MALSRKNRLNSEKNFDLVFQRGKTVKDSFFFIKYLPNELGFSRWSFSVPVKITKKSTARNYIKRIVSQITRNNFLNLSFDFIFIASQPILDKSSDEIKGHLEQAIKKISSQP